MLHLNRFIFFVTLLTGSLHATANDNIAHELAVLKKVMEARQARVEKAMKDVRNSQLNPQQFVMHKLPHEMTKFEGRTLKCKISHFSWLGKLDGYEYEDCIFSFNIKSDDEIKAMFNTIANRGLNGWEIDRIEQTGQNNVAANQIKNVEKYRFKRLLTKANSPK